MASPVTVVVLNYNGKEITLQALQSVTGLSYPDYHVVVVDNGSTDGSYEAVAAAFPKVELLRSEKNLGAAGGYNLGIRHALKRGSPYLLVLNNDIEVDPHLLQELVASAESDPKIGCVGPKTYYYWDRERIWSAGGRIRFREAVTKERGDGEIDRGQWDRDEEVSYVNGCGMLMRREAVLAAGLWDPIYHLAVEDADWCTRVKRSGWRIRYAHRAVLYHMVSAATGVYTPKRTFQTGRSTAIFVRRYARPHQWLSYLLCAFGSLPVAFLRELPRGNQRAVIEKARGMLQGLRVPLTPPPAV